MIRWGMEYFEKKNIESPRLTIELMLCAVMKVSRLQLYMVHDKPLSREELAVMRDMVARRVKREPLQYILGRTNFYGLDIAVSPAVLIPRPETEMLADLAVKALARRKAEQAELKPSVLDIGTGSGCIALALAKAHPDLRILALDVSEAALALAGRNASGLGLENIRFEKRNILTELPGGQFDLIVSNPPYIAPGELAESEPEVKNFEPEIALTDKADGLTFYRRFAGIFATMLAPGGEFFLEMGYGQAEAVGGIFAAAGYDCDIIADYEKIPRIIHGRKSAQITRI